MAGGCAEIRDRGVQRSGGMGVQSFICVRGVQLAFVEWGKVSSVACFQVDHRSMSRALRTACARLQEYQVSCFFARHGT